MTHFQDFPCFMKIMFLVLCLLGPPTRAAKKHGLVEHSIMDDLIRVAGYGDEKLSTVVVRGSLICNTCSNEDSMLHQHPISGALVAISCQRDKLNRVRGTTDQYGDFLIEIPSNLHALSHLERRCLVKIVQLPKHSPCHRAFTGKHTGIRFVSAENGVRTYTAHGIHLTRTLCEKAKQKQAK